jgi:iron complex outermembrane receptor protein
VVLGLGASAHAATDSSAMAAHPQQVEEVVVAATRRAIAAEKVGAALTALSREDLKVQAPKTLLDLQGMAPNVFIGSETGGPAQSLIYIRGQGYGDVEKTQATPVGVMLDGVSFGNSTGQLVDMFDVCSVEVDRGPQGIFYGKNTTAGLINITRCAPTRRWGASVEAGYGSFNDSFVRGVFNAPLGDNGGLKVAGQWHTNDGYDKNVFTHEQAGGDRMAAVHAVANYDVTHWLNANLSFDHQRDNGGGDPVQNGDILISKITPGYGAIFPNYNPRTGSPDGLAPWQVNNRAGGDSDVYNSDTLSLILKAKTPVGELFSQTAYINEADTVTQDYDGTCNTLFGVPPGCVTAGNALYGSLPLQVIRTQHYRQFTQEEHLTGSFLSQFDYIVGAFYYQHEIQLHQNTDIAVNQYSEENDKSWAEFGNLDWNPTSTIKLSAGVRNISESKTFSTDYPGITAPIDDSHSWTKAITRFNAQWQVTPETLVYANRSEGFRSGGFSIRGTLSESIPGQSNYAPTNNFLAFLPETNVSYEVGVKNHFFDNAVVFNFDGFINDITGLQQSEVVLTPGYGPGTNTYIVNFPKTEIKGLEFELVAKVAKWAPALDGLTLSANVGIQSARVINGTVLAAEVPTATGVGGAADGSTVNFAGSPLQHIPSDNFTIRGTYVHDFGQAKLTLGAGYSWIAKYTLATLGVTPDVQPSYGLLDASATVDWKNYSVKLTGKNLTDVAYRSFSLPSVAIQGWSPPRVIEIEFGAKF